MRIYIVIPAHNEQEFIGLCLESVIRQSFSPSKVVVVNDHCSDNTENIVKSYCNKVYPYLSYINTTSSDKHMPGGKVINAFLKGLKTLDSNFDIILKLDSDIILPKDYLEKIASIFQKNSNVGIAGGFAYELNKNGSWTRHHPMNLKHVRGAFKAYSKECFESIGGLKPYMGWDTLDELLCLYNGFDIITEEHLHLKHLRPTASAYDKSAKQLQGEAMYRMDYGLLLSLIASIKIAYKQRNWKIVRDNISGFFKASQAKTSKIVSPDEGLFIRKYRYNGIFKKLLRQSSSL